MLNYRMVWRWHFYAGLFTLPFILILCMSGSVYLFKPQIEAWLDRPYDQLTHAGQPKPISQQVQAALDAFPGSTAAGYQLPRHQRASAQVLVQQNDQVIRVYVDPWTLGVLHSVPDKDRLMRTVFRLHGELWMGNRGSNLVEIAASWTIILILTGLYLWWPRQASGIGGILYPRFNKGWTTGLRDLHAVVGVWASLCILFMLLTGLPWANFWGHYFKAVRQWAGIVSQQDWSIGSDSSPQKKPVDGDSMGMGMSMRDRPAHGGSHIHHHHDGQAIDLAAFDRIFATVKDMPLDFPVVISPPSERGATWSVKSLTDNRPRQVTLLVDGNSGEISQRQNFQSRPLLDRIVQTCIAAHEGQLFGWPNQVLGLLTALGLMTLSITGTWMWWRRRQGGALGAPPEGERSGKPILLAIAIVTLVIYLPLFGATVLLVFLLERILVQFSPPAAKWLRM
ncbi:MAG TPA: PepSY domain-containing protein [Pseudomonadales bacterium]|nr:PepSY domain-containing protein [Pseudomonadales bacterium]